MYVNVWVSQSLSVIKLALSNDSTDSVKSNHHFLDLPPIYHRPSGPSFKFLFTQFYVIMMIWSFCLADKKFIPIAYLCKWPMFRFVSTSCSLTVSCLEWIVNGNGNGKGIYVDNHWILSATHTNGLGHILFAAAFIHGTWPFSTNKQTMSFSHDASFFFIYHLLFSHDLII